MGDGNGAKFRSSIDGKFRGRVEVRREDEWAKCGNLFFRGSNFPLNHECLEKGLNLP